METRILIVDDDPFICRQLEELYTSGASGNGIAFFNVGNALPTAHLYTASYEIEE